MVSDMKQTLHNGRLAANWTTESQRTSYCLENLITVYLHNLVSIINSDAANRTQLRETQRLKTH